jgi:hypothetical protein
MYSYSTTALLCCSGAAAAAALLRERSPRLARASGLAFGLGVLCKQDYAAAASARRVHRAPGVRAQGRIARRCCRCSACSRSGGARRRRSGPALPARRVLGDVLRLTVFNHFVGIASYEYPAFPDLFPLFGQDPAARRAGRAQYRRCLFTADWRAMRELALLGDGSLRLRDEDLLRPVRARARGGAVCCGGARRSAALATSAFCPSSCSSPLRARSSCS